MGFNNMPINKRTLGKYELFEELGRGGFGTVYRARDTVLDVERAVKVLHPALLAAPEFIERFKREAKFAAWLEHPHIMPIYEVAEEKGAWYLVMKYLPGGSLKDVLKREDRLSFARALEVARQAAEALDYAHQQGLVHRDVKPGNLLFDSGGSVRLSDFGFAKALSPADGGALSTSGSMIGTPSYMAPEVWQGGEVTPSTDQYSLACMFFEMLTGQALFEGDSPPQVMTKHMLAGPKFPENWPAGVPEGLGDVLRKALDKDPAGRFPSATTFVNAIAQLGMDEQARRITASKAQALLQAAREHQKADDLEAAHTELLQAYALVPEWPEVQGLLEQVEKEMKVKVLYESAASHVDTARDQAKQVLAEAPAHKDPAGIFPLLELRKGEKALLKTQAKDQVGSVSWRPILWITLGWMIGGIIGLLFGDFFGISEFWALGIIIWWSIGGYINGQVLHKNFPKLGSKFVMWVTLIWSGSGLIGQTICWLTGGAIDPSALSWIFGWLIGGALGGLGTGLILWKRVPVIRRTLILWISLVWAVGWTITGEIFYEEISFLAITMIIGSISSMVSNIIIIKRLHKAMINNE
jgi:hypothetical protein